MRVRCVTGKELRQSNFRFTLHGNERTDRSCLYLYHLAHFTVRVTDPRFWLLKADPLNRYDVYSMMVYGFQNIFVSTFYVLAMFLLALHLSHGTSSFFQSLGLNDEKLTPRLATAGRIFAWLIFVGYTSIPVAVLLHLVEPAQSYDW